MPARPYLPGFQPNPELDLLFFALRVGVENAARVVQSCDRLCRQNGLRGRRIAADLLHITLHGVGAYDGLPDFVVERAREAGASVSTSPFPLMFDLAVSFNSGRGKRPLVLCPTSDLAGLFRLHLVLGEAMKRARIARHLRSRFTPHMTLLYDTRIVPELRIEPILIHVRDFVLVHSIVGQQKHIELARWPLRG
jgi:RNA 2',3'-cyclic 3'-phosphodiesterase